jgi:hypothetical protein
MTKEILVLILFGALIIAAALALFFSGRKPSPLDDSRPKRRKVEGIPPSDPRIARDFNTVFSIMSKQAKEDLIQRWTNRKKCSREEAMRLAVEDWRSDRAHR